MQVFHPVDVLVIFACNVVNVRISQKGKNWFKIPRLISTIVFESIGWNIHISNLGCHCYINRKSINILVHYYIKL